MTNPSCAWCDGPNPPPAHTGRPPVFCSSACRIAHRAQVQHLEARIRRLEARIESADRGLLRWSEAHVADERALLDDLGTALHDLRARSGPTPQRNPR